MRTAASSSSGLLLDTHVLVRHVLSVQRLGRRTSDAIEHALRDDRAFVATVSFWELGTLVEKGRLQLDGSVRDFARRHCNARFANNPSTDTSHVSLPSYPTYIWILLTACWLRPP